MLMPFIRFYIPTSAEFDPAALASMGEAYERALASFSEFQNQAIREAVAGEIINLAQQGLLDPIKLCERAVAAYGLQSRCSGNLKPRDTHTPV
jgi:hypothetical protein